MSIEKMREEFEAWFEANKHFMLGTRKVSKGDCFFIWQASRAALVIELPKRDGVNMYGTDVLEINEVRQAIEAAGVKVKP